MSHNGRDDIDAGLAEHEAGETLSEAQVRQIFGPSTSRSGSRLTASNARD
jgi:hypothetical protein